jgi:hypothetical protein
VARFAQFSPRPAVGNENVSQMYSSPISVVQDEMYNLNYTVRLKAHKV